MFLIVIMKLEWLQSKIPSALNYFPIHVNILDERKQQ